MAASYPLTRAAAGRARRRGASGGDGLRRIGIREETVGAGEVIGAVGGQGGFINTEWEPMGPVFAPRRRARPGGRPGERVAGRHLGLIAAAVSQPNICHAIFEPHSPDEGERRPRPRSRDGRLPRIRVPGLRGGPAAGGQSESGFNARGGWMPRGPMGGRDGERPGDGYARPRSPGLGRENPPAAAAAMRCLVSGGNVTVIGRAIHALARIGDECYLEALEEGLALRSVNSSRLPLPASSSLRSSSRSTSRGAAGLRETQRNPRRRSGSSLSAAKL
ncbi:uncharacterized protein [Heptranchias perlo]|uniref:uncharacterized protein n=1 Tax=Heptranchias perlo TaxID=212740 RepID=UPI00355A0B22